MLLYYLSKNACGSSHIKSAMAELTGLPNDCTNVVLPCWYTTTHMDIAGPANPILVRPLQNDPDYDFDLICGLHRLVGQKSKGRCTILARIADLDEDHARLLQIDENLFRQDLTSAENALALGERKTLHDEHHQDESRGAHAATRSRNRTTDASVILTPAFTTQVAKATGASLKTVQRSVARAASLGPEELRRVVGTSLDHGAELDALTKLAPAERTKLIDQVAKGQKVSAKQFLRQTSTESRGPEGKYAETHARLQAIWDALPREQQDLFLAHNGLKRAAT